MGKQEPNNFLLYKLFKPEKLSTIVFYLSILFFVIGFNFADTPTPFGWYQQFMPNIGNRQITDVFFLDSLTGWAVTNSLGQNDTSYVIKTTNGGDNWVMQYRKIQQYTGYSKVHFLNQNTGYTCGQDDAGFISGFNKSTDGGATWISLNVPDPAGNYLDMAILNIDTQWVVTIDPLGGGVFRTTNGGVNWTQQLFLGSQNPSHIYMYNARIGFAATGAGLYRTTNSGLNWLPTSGGFFFSMYFADSLTGWKCHQLMEKTTDGGTTWVNLPLPSSGNFLFNYMIDFSNIVKDTIWGAGPVSSTNKALIYKSTDGGMNFGYQVIDPSINIFQFQHSKFVDKLKGWEYSGSTGVHTTTGGDTTTYYTGINPISNIIPKDFKLYQNYPNPFNPVTNFKFQISKLADVKVTVYDMTGKVMQVLVSRRLNVGEYKVDFDGTNYSSGVYFYSLFTEGNLIETKKMILIK